GIRRTEKDAIAPLDVAGGQICERAAAESGDPQADAVTVRYSAVVIQDKASVAGSIKGRGGVVTEGYSQLGDLVLFTVVRETVVQGWDVDCDGHGILLRLASVPGGAADRRRSGSK